MHATSLGSLNLRLFDLPRGFTLTDHHVWNNAAAAKLDHTTVAELNRRGRINSVENVFKSRLPIQGMINVDASIASYRSGSGAHWIFLRNAHSLKGAKESGHPLVSMPIARIGNESAGFTVDFILGSFHYTADLVSFRQGSHFFDMQVVGLQHLYKPAQVDHLALIVDKRILRAH